MDSHLHDARLMTNFSSRKSGTHKGKPRATTARSESSEAGVDQSSAAAVMMKSRISWREQIDSDLRRLMLEQELDLDSRLTKDSQDHLRCAHMDRVYDWYERHGGKQQRKEKPAPSFLSFEPDAPVMPGSLRSVTVAPALRDARRRRPSVNIPTFTQHGAQERLDSMRPLSDGTNSAPATFPLLEEESTGIFKFNEERSGPLDDEDLTMSGRRPLGAVATSTSRQLTKLWRR